MSDTIPQQTQFAPSRKNSKIKAILLLLGVLFICATLGIGGAAIIIPRVLEKRIQTGEGAAIFVKLIDRKINRSIDLSEEQKAALKAETDALILEVQNIRAEMAPRIFEMFERRLANFEQSLDEEQKETLREDLESIIESARISANYRPDNGTE